MDVNRIVTQNDMKASQTWNKNEKDIFTTDFVCEEQGLSGRNMCQGSITSESSKLSAKLH